MAKTERNTAEVISSNESTAPVARSISEVLGIDPILPGESPIDYRQGLKDLIEELGAKTVLQVYMAEKIYDCLWWIRRYEEQKRATIIAEMASIAAGGQLINLRHQEVYVREALMDNVPDDKVLEIARDKGHSLDSLRQKAFSKRRGEIQNLDQQIALQTKILAGLQSSYEIAFNRKRNVERMDLQNAMMRRDLGVIEGEVDGKPKAKGRQQS